MATVVDTELTGYTHFFKRCHFQFIPLWILIWFDGFTFYFLGQTKLGKIITPDPWKAGARNTTGILLIYMVHCANLFFFIWSCKLLLKQKQL